MDLTQSIAPKSDQINAEDFITGPRTVTITDVRAGSVEQPVMIDVAEFPNRPFKPSKTVIRILVAAWGKEASAYVGRRLTLYRDPTVRWAGEQVGGIRVSAMSHIDIPLSIMLTTTRGRRAPHVVEPLKDRDWLSELAQTNGDLDAIAVLGKAAQSGGAPSGVVQQIRDAYQQANTAVQS